MDSTSLSNSKPKAKDKAIAKTKNKTKNELKTHKETKEAIELLSKTESLYSNDPQYVTEYSSTIIDHLKETEVQSSSLYT